MRSPHLLMAAVFCLIFACAADAAQRTFVSAATGNDANPCSRLSPCRNFDAAIDATDAGGELIVLDSGGYGPVLISQGVSIIAPPGVYAGIASFTGTAMVVAPVTIPQNRVVIRGISVNGLGGSTAIDFVAGGVLSIDNCVISGFSTGINVNRAGAGENIYLYVSNTVVRNGGLIGPTLALYMQETGSGSSRLTAVIDSSQFLLHNYGVAVADNTQATLRNSIVSSNQYGITVSSRTGFAASITVEGCAISSNSSGVSAGDIGSPFIGGTDVARLSNCLINDTRFTALNGGVNGKVYVGFSTITGSNLGLTGQVISLGNNRVFDNTTAGTFSSTISQQ